MTLERRLAGVAQAGARPVGTVTVHGRRELPIV